MTAPDGVTLASLDEPEDGAAILDEVRAAITTYVILPSAEAAVAVTLYIAATHAQPAWEHATRLVIRSPLKRCGKTRLQEVCRELVYKAMPTANISAAALVRAIGEADPPVLILDEADTVFSRAKDQREAAEDLRGILNSGHSRGWPYIRWNAATSKQETCPTFAMAIIGGIGAMPDTIEDRAVVVEMRRRAPGETVTPWRARKTRPALNGIRDRLNCWVRAHLEDLETAEPAVPAEDRAGDTWEPLIAVADLAGGHWPELARAACRAMTRAGDDPGDRDSAGERLLADVRATWPRDSAGACRAVATADLLAALAAIEEAPWRDWYGRPLDARALAVLLRPYGVRSRQQRLADGRNVKGYQRADFADSWQRYLPPAAGDDACNIGDAPDGESGVTRRLTEPNAGPCAQCGGATLRYGEAGSPLCVTCRAGGGK